MSPSKLKIILADDHEVFRVGLKRILDSSPDMEVVGEANDGEALLQLLENVPADIVVIDLKMPKISGIMLGPIIKEKWPTIKIVVLTVYNDIEHARAVLKHGVNAYLLKSDSANKIMEAIKEVITGKVIISPEISHIAYQEMENSTADELPLLDVLSKREYQVFKCLLSGKANKEIADILNLSVRTIEVHRANVYKKMNVDSVTELLKLAIKSGLDLNS